MAAVSRRLARRRGRRGSAAAGSERERGGGVGVERVAGTADARDWRAVGEAAEEPGRGRGETGWVLAKLGNQVSLTLTLRAQQVLSMCGSYKYIHITKSLCDKD